MFKRGFTQFIQAEAAGKQALITKGVDAIGKIKRSSPQNCFIGKNIPEDLSVSKNSFFHSFPVISAQERMPPMQCFFI